MRRVDLMSAMLGVALLAVPHASLARQSGASNNSPAAQGSSSQANPTDTNAFPEDTSKKAAGRKKDAPQTQKPDPSAPPATDGVPSQDNAFPEETSRKAADAAKAAEAPTSSSTSSSSSSADGDTIQHNVKMPHDLLKKETLKEDIQVGTFYLQSGDFIGAYARFKAAAALHPESTDAMFGLAEAARHLKKTEEAEQNYSLFLEIVPTGSKARDARKALAALEKAQR